MGFGMLLLIGIQIWLLYSEKVLAENEAELLRHSLIHQMRHPPSDTYPPAYMLPVNYEPWPNQDPTAIDPEFPMTHQYAMASNVNQGDIAALFGNLKVPSLKHNKLWTLKGDLDAGPDDTAIQHGHIVGPVNPLSIPKDDILRTIQDPEYQRHLATVPRRSVMDMPNGFQPFICRPPICNPYVQTFGMNTVHNFPNPHVIGNLEVTSFGKKPGEPDYMLPLNGTLLAGVQPLEIQYAHALSPFNGFFGRNRAPLPPQSGQPSSVQFEPFLPPRRRRYSHLLKRVMQMST